MTQMTYGKPQAMAREGETYNTREHKTDTKTGSGKIYAGRKLMFLDANKKIVSMIAITSVLLVNSGNLDGSDTYSFTLKVKNEESGVETTNNITTTFNTDHATTMNAIVTQLEAITGIDDTKTLFDSVNNKLVIAVESGYTLAVENQVTGGGSTVTITKVNQSNMFAGFSKNNGLMIAKTENGQDVIYYDDKDIIDMLTDGELIVKSPTGFNGTDTLHYICSGNDQGRITNTAGVNTIPATDIKHYKSAVGTYSKGVITVKD